MIDRIVIQIQDVEEDYIVERLDLREDSTRGTDEVPKYVGEIKSLKKRTIDSRRNKDKIRVSYFPYSKLLRLDGSLHIFAHGYNDTLFTCEDAGQAIKKLASIVGIKLERFFLTKIEFGINIFVPKEAMEYIDKIFSYGSRNFLPMTPLTSTVYGIRSKAYNYQIKLYDKAYQAWEERRIEKTNNILRFEIMMNKVYATDNGFADINAKGLIGIMYYAKLRKLMQDIFSEFRYKGKYLDFSNPALNPKDVEKYMFITSDNFNAYLDYLSEYGKKHDKPNLRDNTMTQRRRLIKKLKPMLTSDLIDEFKHEFHETLKIVSDKKFED